MRTRSQQYESMDVGASASTFSQHALAHFSGQPSAHEAAPLLLECVAAVCNDSLDLNALPSGSSLSDEAKQWLTATLIDCGFEAQPDGKLHASPELLDSLRKEQNAARRQAHAMAAASREALLTSTLAGIDQKTSASLTLGSARAALKQFLASFDGQPAVGPLLLGMAALLKGQGVAGEVGMCWHLDRATLLNGGDEFVRQGVPLLAAAFGLVPSLTAESGNGAAALEEGMVAEELSLEVSKGAWADHEMHALASILERKGGRYGARGGGRVEPSTGGVFTPRAIPSWPAWVASVVGAWLFRLSPLV